MTKAYACVVLGATVIAAIVLALPTLDLVAGCVRSDVWPRSLLAVTVTADAAIAMAYAWIPVTLLGVWRRRRDVPVSWTLVSFAAFIVLCGATHVMAIVTAFRPVYWLAAEIDLAAAAVSLVTAYLLQARVGPILLKLKAYSDVVADADAARGESEELRVAKAAADELAVALAAATSRAEQGRERAVGEAADLRQALDELRRAEGTIAAQRVAIAELSTPILHLWDDVLTLPVVGTVDSRRAADMTEALLAEISRTGARFAIIDVTGVSVMDTGTVAHLASMARAAGLMGSACVVTGIRPDVARTLVASGVEMGGVQTVRSLEQGLRWCLARIGRDTV